MGGSKSKPKRKVAWGITGSGDKLREIIDLMKEIEARYHAIVDLSVYLSRAGEQVVKWYRLSEDLKQNFGKILIEKGANLPFLAGQLQTGRFELLLIAPATSNTVAKISAGIADSMLSNSAIMALKASVPVYVMPSDSKEGTVVTKLPNGQDLKLKVRKEDVENVRRLRGMEGLSVLERPEQINEIFKKHFATR